MKRSLSQISLCVMLLTCLAAGAGADENSGTFRGKWWNYYDRGVSLAEGPDLDKAMSDLRQAVRMREKDQRMARTYGMHFIDYFPHREIGVIHLNRGEIKDAIRELEESIRGEESAKAVYYLNKARKTEILQKSGGKSVPPSISVSEPAEGFVTRNLSVTIRGRAKGEGLVSKVLVNNSPFRFELAKEEMAFEKVAQVDDGENRIVVSVEDLLGNRTEKSLVVTVDREGPSITVFDMVPEGKDGKKMVRVTGEISDTTGIKDIVISGKTIKAGNAKDYRFNEVVEIHNQGSQPAKFVIQALDSLDNDTKAEMEIEKDLVAFLRRPEPVLLAFNAPKILSFDKEQPVLTLKDVPDPPMVFVDKYYIEGEAIDNKTIDRVVINRADVTIKKGKKVFFSKILKLNEGKNKIVIEVYDGSGNKDTKEITVDRHIPQVLQVGSRMTVTLLPFDTKQKEAGYSDLAYDKLIDSFVDQKRFNIVERTKLDKVLLEQKLTKAKLTDPEHSIKVGRLMSADAIIATSVKEDKKSIEVVSRVINTETSQVMEVKDVFTEDKSLGTVKELMEGLSSKIAASFPLVEGMVINKGGKEVFTDVGDSAKIRKDMDVIFYRRGKEIKHPVTGKSLGWDTIKLGDGRIEEVQKDFSKVKLTDKAGSQEINVKDMMMTK